MNKQRARQKKKREVAASLAVKASPVREVNAPMFEAYPIVKTKMSEN